jgi:ElaB/YqjD/DUF883 family membrane-anchored ribosome-binding protein
MPERLHRNTVDPGINLSKQLGKENAAPESPAVLEERAREIGNSMGRAVVALREARGKLHHLSEQTREISAGRMATWKSQAEQTRARIGDMAGDMARNLKDKGRRWSEAAATAATELRHATAAKASDVRSQARIKYYRARLRGNHAVREYPMQLVLVAGVVGFLVGVGLRVWRSKHED